MHNNKLTKQALNKIILDYRISKQILSKNEHNFKIYY